MTISCQDLGILLEMKDLNNPNKQRGLVIWKHTEYDLLDIVNVNPVSNPKQMRQTHTETHTHRGQGGEAVIPDCMKSSCTIIKMCILFKIPKIDERKEEACDLQIANQ
jgi:hypothetical protein